MKIALCFVSFLEPLAWEKPPPILNELQTNQQYIQPWSSGNVPNHNMHPPQIPVNNYNAAPFVSNNSYPYVQQSQHQVLQPQQHIFQQQQQHVMQQQQPIFQSQPFAQNQVFMNPLPLMNTPLLNHNVAPQPMPIQVRNWVVLFLFEKITLLIVTGEIVARLKLINYIQEPLLGNGR